ncbi:hypothetical protein DFR58_14216 [Anaerobacterium chartisolvens]|uniref:Uncharacterized protein n=1 Tax=Anaerobacterium chartisolvens TaxID=1297424 RepID=A0A369AH57_9FIRM|nr:hypothetical protein [Anaerobacterium chartisolvens]RCX08501.1 hypothetical protein DFR58_14216 [Anaerobacterium chartisolvens]
MEWYWWIVIIAALTGIIFLKVKVGGAWMKKQKEKKEMLEKIREDED